MSARMISIAVVTASDSNLWDKTLMSRARAVGKLVADLGCNLITGGGEGGMAIVAQAFCETPYRVGRSIGVIPGKVDWNQSEPFGAVGELKYTPKSGYPNPWIETPIFTHLPGGKKDIAKGENSRNIVNVISAHLVVVLPGGDGAQAELELAVAFHDKPVFVLLRSQDAVGSYNPARVPGQTVNVVDDLETLQRLIKTELASFALPRPSFAELLKVYKPKSTDVHSCSMKFPNTCAIRMSEALDQAVPGIKAKFIASGLNLCPHQFVRGSQDLASILRRADAFGTYNQGFTAPGQPPGTITDQKGLIAYHDIPSYPEGQGHIALWDGRSPVGDAYWSAETIWFWNLD